ncbi:MAG TPA: twin-arginine translocation signal domain-containing protein [Actinomycetota bacterium]|jgi:hypothetical protein
MTQQKGTKEDALLATRLSRRRFLQVAGVGGATLGL